MFNVPGWGEKGTFAQQGMQVKNGDGRCYRQSETVDVFSCF